MKAKIEQSPAINPNPVLSVTKTGTVLYSNEAGESLLREWGIEVRNKLPTNIEEIIKKVVSHNSSEKIEVKVGNRVYLVTFHPSPEGECVNVYGFDISDQKGLEEKLRVKEKQNDVLHQIGKIALECDSIQTFMDESVKLIASILGLEYCKIMELLPDGRFLLRAGIGWKRDFVGKHVVGGEKGSQAGYTLLSGMPVIVEDFEVENRFKKPEILKTHGVASGASVVIGSKENIFGVLVVNSTKKRKFTSEDTYFLTSVAFLIAQVVERKNAEEALRESEEKFRSVLENSLDAAYRRDLQTDRYDYMSPVIEQITGFSSMEMSAMSVNEALDHMHPDDRSCVASELTRALGAGIGTFDYRFRCKDGNYRWLADYFKVIKDINGCPHFISGVVRDITERKRVEEILTVERSQLLSIFDGIDDLVYVADPYTYEVLYVNKAMKEKFGGEYVGGICYREFQRKASPCDFCTNPIILKERDKPYRWEYYNPSVDRFFMIMDRIIKWPDGRDVRLEIAKDITDRKRTEEALRESEEKYRELFESSVDGIIVTDLAGNIMKVNPAYEKMLGYSIEELQHLSYQQLTPARWHESEAHVVREQVFKLGYSDEYEKEYIRKDGSIFPISIRVWLSIDKEGQPQGMWGIVRDITERKKIEEALLESEASRKVAEAVKVERQRFYNVLETLPAMICLLTHDCHIVFANRSYRKKFGESGGLHCYESRFGRTQPCEFCESYKVFETGQIHNWKVITPDGSIIDTYDVPFTDFDGTPMILKMDIDITERKEAEEALEKIEKIRVKEIHHRIKNNLQVISSLLDLQADKFIDENVIEAFREGQNRVISMSLIHEELYKGGENDTLDFSAYLKKLAESLFQTYSLSSKNIRLSMDLEDNAFLDIDTAVPLGIIVNELISNSLKHAFTKGEEGKIRVNLSREEGSNTSFTLSISDNGVGIPESIDIEVLDSLGLQLVTTLIEQLDGELELKRDKGTEFTMRFTVTEKNNQSSCHD